MLHVFINCSKLCTRLRNLSKIYIIFISSYLSNDIFKIVICLFIEFINSPGACANQDFLLRTLLSTYITLFMSKL